MDGTDPGQVTQVRREIGDYLDRHCAAGLDLEGAGVVVAGLLSNVVRHSPGPAWVHIAWHEIEPVLDVHDLGQGFDLNPELPPDPYALGGRGLAVSAALTPRLERAAKRAGGSKVTAVLPVWRRVEVNVDPLIRTGRGLSAPEEADENGLFGKEPFLRALVVELAREVDQRDGPSVAAELVAEVGMSVGARMEAEYRRARNIVGQVDPEQLADLFVRLKAAIDGDFYVVDADERRIILTGEPDSCFRLYENRPGLR